MCFSGVRCGCCHVALMSWSISGASRRTKFSAADRQALYDVVVVVIVVVGAVVSLACFGARSLRGVDIDAFDDAEACSAEAKVALIPTLLLLFSVDTFSSSRLRSTLKVGVFSNPAAGRLVALVFALFLGVLRILIPPMPLSPPPPPQLLFILLVLLSARGARGVLLPPAPCR